MLSLVGKIESVIRLKGFLGGSAVMNLPTMQATQETWVQSLGREDPLKEGMANYSSILAWKIPWTEEPGRLQSMGSQRVGHNRSRCQVKHCHLIGETH